MSFEKAMTAIDEGHKLDPKLMNGKPYELHYAEQCSHYLAKLKPDASDLLKLAVRAQHYRRFEVPRQSYPMTKAGYFAWRTMLKKRQGEMAAEICLAADYEAPAAERVAQMIRKDKFKEDAETQTLEDVACLVFLDDQFDAFEQEHDEAKIISIVQKTWRKMSAAGHAQALKIEMSEVCSGLVTKALA